AGSPGSASRPARHHRPWPWQTPGKTPEPHRRNPVTRTRHRPGCPQDGRAGTHTPPAAAGYRQGSDRWPAPRPRPARKSSPSGPPSHRRGPVWPANRAALPLRRTPPTGTPAAHYPRAAQDDQHTCNPSPGTENCWSLSDARRRLLETITGYQPHPSAAGSRASGPGIPIGNPARRRALVPPGHKRAGVSRELLSGAWGIVALGDDSGDAPADDGLLAPLGARAQRNCRDRPAGHLTYQPGHRRLVTNGDSSTVA